MNHTVWVQFYLVFATFFLASLLGYDCSSLGSFPWTNRSCEETSGEESWSDITWHRWKTTTSLGCTGVFNGIRYFFFNILLLSTDAEYKSQLSTVADCMHNVVFFQVTGTPYTITITSIWPHVCSTPSSIFVINYLSCATTTLYQLLYVLYCCGSVLREVDILNLSVQHVGAYHCHHGISFATLNLSYLHPAGLNS